ncbi:hypothetical protein HO133_003842 [Letharia lupina]|uniref:Uncharacterized protein n=1 Tax=Letharia lupina TaxID=560253 RepID=A0A8H6CAN8_9LECA|nr:uncharacterized protein HO133_003842 [Letharia lupina]KAF6220017.1 hypothetical protein HO133_003842 [Letharia lupina]
MDVITSEVVYTTVTSCPVASTTHTEGGSTSIEVVTSVSTFLTTDTVTICTRCTATTPSFTPASSTPAAATTTATGSAVNTPSNSGSSAAASTQSSAVSSPAPTTMLSSFSPLLPTFKSISDSVKKMINVEIQVIVKTAAAAAISQT